MRDVRNFALNWLAIVSVITLAIVPIRLYLLSANDWLIGVVSTLGLVFVVAYFLIAWLWKADVPKTAP